MPKTPDVFFTRRTVLAGLAALAATPALAARAKVVTMLGDSITAGYGLPAGQSLPAQLQAELARLGRPAVIRNAGVSGDTTADGLRRVDFSVKAGTSVCVVALGGNDLLEGREPKQLRANLEKIVRRLQQRGITVVLAGVRAPVALGGDYAREFNAAFDAVSRIKGVIAYPNLLEGVAGNRALNQRDGIHPNAAGAKIIAHRLAPTVAKALALSH
jgi:acyl-CoA thioesterase-1